jgi:putative membrane protein
MPAGSWYAEDTPVFRTLSPLVRGLLVAYTVIWAALAIAPHDRSDWLLENVLVLVAALMVWRSQRREPLRDSIWVALFVFGVLHAIGSHYTYSHVPYVDWLRATLGDRFAAPLVGKRNHFDRLVHFSYGVLCTPLFAALLARVVTAQTRLWAALLPLGLITSTSMIYELIEWAAAIVFGADLGQAFLGTQGDVWDAHKDMALASLGSLITLAWMAARGTLRASRAI